MAADEHRHTLAATDVDLTAAELETALTALWFWRKRVEKRSPIDPAMPTAHLSMVLSGLTESDEVAFKLGGRDRELSGSGKTETRPPSLPWWLLSPSPP